MVTSNDIIKKAQSWIGCKESNGTHKKIIDVYNSHKPLARGYTMQYNDEWCATFVSACAIACNATNIIPTEIGCEKMVGLLKNKGIWREDENITPKPGWIIFYDWDDNGVGDNKGWTDHVGIVEKVSNGIITVIEGNLNSSVARRNIKVNGKYIRGYGMPKYSEPTPAPTPKPDPVPGNKLKYKVGDTVTIKEVFISSTSSEVLIPNKKTGKITKIVEGARNPYLLENGNIGWINNESVTSGGSSASKPETSSYYSKYSGSSMRIDEVLKAIGVPSKYLNKWSNRIPVAKANGISNYEGTSKQNETLISYAKKGKLKKA